VLPLEDQWDKRLRQKCELPQPAPQIRARGAPNLGIVESGTELGSSPSHTRLRIFSHLSETCILDRASLARSVGV
jgi:hypothetical protein